MSINDIKDPTSVISAVNEYDRLGGEGFLEEYGFGKAQSWYLRYQGKLYDSKAILGVAHGYEFPGRYLRHEEFNGGEATVVSVLRNLGFECIEMGVSSSRSGHASERIFGEIPGYPSGTEFANRKELSAAGVHRPLQAGISGGQGDGAESIVLSGGYEDDEDHWDFIIYTGQGGQENGRQVRDQELTRGNIALKISCDEGMPVRVIEVLEESSLGIQKLDIDTMVCTTLPDMRELRELRDTRFGDIA
jgi:hypothetical protein